MLTGQLAKQLGHLVRDKDEQSQNSPRQAKSNKHCFGVEDLDKQAGLREAFYRDLVLIGIVAPYLYLSRRIRELAGNRES